jgi:hypothetical protein
LRPQPVRFHALPASYVAVRKARIGRPDNNGGNHANDQTRIQPRRNRQTGSRSRVQRLLAFGVAIVILDDAERSDKDRRDKRGPSSGPRPC